MWLLFPEVFWGHFRRVKKSVKNDGALTSSPGAERLRPPLFTAPSGKDSQILSCAPNSPDSWHGHLHQSSQWRERCLTAAPPLAGPLFRDSLPDHILTHRAPPRGRSWISQWLLLARPLFGQQFPNGAAIGSLRQHLAEKPLIVACSPAPKVVNSCT